MTPTIRSRFSEGLLSASKQMAPRFAEKLAVDHHKVDDAFWSDPRTHFSEAEIVGIDPEGS